MSSLSVSIFDAQLRTELQAYTIGLIRTIHEKFKNIPYTELIELVTSTSRCPTQQCIAQSSKTKKQCSHKAVDSTGLCKKHIKNTSKEKEARISLEYIQIQDQDYLYDHDTGIVYTYSKEPKQIGTLDSFVQNTASIKIL